MLAQKRPSQESAWSALRAAQVHQTVKITSVVIPDGAPTATTSSALVRVGYTLKTTPKSGDGQSTGEQLALRMEHTSAGWRVTDLPWA